MNTNNGERDIDGTRYVTVEIDLTSGPVVEWLAKHRLKMREVLRNVETRDFLYLTDPL